MNPIGRLLPHLRAAVEAVRRFARVTRSLRQTGELLLAADPAEGGRVEGGRVEPRPGAGGDVRAFLHYQGRVTEVQPGETLADAADRLVEAMAETDEARERLKVARARARAEIADLGRRTR